MNNKGKRLGKFLKFLYFWLLFTFFTTILSCVILIGGVCYEVNDLKKDEIAGFPFNFTEIPSLNLVNDDGCEIISSDEWEEKISWYKKRLWLSLILVILMVLSNRFGDIKNEVFKYEK